MVFIYIYVFKSQKLKFAKICEVLQSFVQLLKTKLKYLFIQRVSVARPMEGNAV